MNEQTLYGKLSSENFAEENQICRQIVKEISQFGVSERQRLFIIYTLALELEDSSCMKAITSAVKSAENKNVFLSKGDSDGTVDF